MRLCTVQPFLGCRNDMDMSIALHGSTLDPMSRLCKAAARPECYQGDSLEICVVCLAAMAAFLHDADDSWT